MKIVDRIYNQMQFQYRKVEVGKHVNIVGKLELQGHGTFFIGDCVTIYSHWKTNPVGSGNGRTVLQTIGKGKIAIGNHSGLSHVTIVSRNCVTIGEHVLLGGGVQIYDNDFHPIKFTEREDSSKIKSAPIEIKDYAFIGADAKILKGVTIGTGAVVGAGSVVTKSVPDYEIWAGNPARFVKKIFPEGIGEGK